MNLTQPSQTLLLKIAGLFTNPNSFSEVPQGALSVAQNGNISRPSVFEKRRGVSQTGDEFPEDTYTTFPYQIFNYKDKLVVWTNDDTTDANKLVYGTGSSTWSDITAGAVTLGSPPYSSESWFSNRFHFLNARKNFYLATDTGVKKLCNAEGPLIQSGGIPALDGSGATTGASGFMNDDSAVGYRIVWEYTDDNDYTIVGSPSAEFIVRNTSGGTRNVALTFTVPPTVTSTDFVYKVYRTFMSATAATDPGDDEYLVISSNITSGQISAGLVTATDITPQSLLGEALYTNVGQEGIAYANAVPPLCQDMCNFNNFTIYANIQDEQFTDITLLSTGATLGLQVNDTVTITYDSETAMVFTAKATETIASNEFKVFTAGTPAENISDTAQSLVRVINRSASNSRINAFYVSTDTGLPGQILLEAIYISDTTFKWTSSRTTCWSPTPTVSGIVSSNNHIQNAIRVSKQNLPEAVPLIQQITVGSENYAILRVIPLRTAVIVLKEDGIYRLTGASFPFTVDPLDLTTNLIGIESAVAMNNTIFAYTNKGVANITEIAVQQISSIPINDILSPIFAPSNVNINLTTYGTAYETEYKYILNLNDNSQSDVYTPNMAYVYDTITKTWTQWIFPVEPWDVIVDVRNNWLALGSSDEDVRNVFYESKTYTPYDFTDIRYEVTIDSYDGTELTVDSTANMEVGWTIAQIETQTDVPHVRILNKSIITEIVDATTVIVEDELVWDTSGSQDTEVGQPITVDLLFTSIYANNPAIVKNWMEFTTIFEESDFKDIEIYFTSSWVSTSISGDMTLRDSAGWGELPFGDGPWGGGLFALQPIRNYFPRQVSQGQWVAIGFRNEEAYTQFSLLGLSITYNNISTRMR